MPVKRRRGARPERTREALIAAARALFAARGFGATATEDILTRAGVSRGALYHQFRDKRDLFLAVFERVEQDLMARLATLVGALDDPVAMLRGGADAFLDLCQEPEVRQIALIDAPSVVGWAAWRAVDARYGLGLVRSVLEQAVARGRIEAGHVPELSHLLLGALSEAALMVAHTGNDPAARRRVGASLSWMIDRLVAPPDPPRSPTRRRARSGAAGRGA